MSETRNPLLRATNTVSVDKGSVNVDKVYWLSKNTVNNTDLLFVMEQGEDKPDYIWKFTNSTNRNNEFTALTASSADFANGLSTKPFITSSGTTVHPKTGETITADAINPSAVTKVSKDVDGVTGRYKIVFTFGRTKVAGNQMAWTFASSGTRDTVYSEITTVVANMSTESESVITGITAGTTQTQGGATALTGEVNNVTTVANANDGVRLPAAATGLKVTVKNNGANILKLYPATSDSIDALAVNLPILVPVNSTVTLSSISGVVWESYSEVLSSDTISERTDATGVTVDSLLIKDGGFVAAGTIDANGQKFILDADADTSITADTDDQIDIEISGADDFKFTANKFEALTGSVIALPDGAVGALPIQFGADGNNGFYGVSDTQLGVAVEGALVATADTLGLTADSLRNRVALGTAGQNVAAVEYGDGRDITTVLTLSSVVLGAPTAGGNSAHGSLVYTFPAGAHLHSVTYMSVGLTVGGVTTDTPDVGVGSVIATGAVAVLGGTATFEDYITGQTAADSAGTATVKTSVATAGALTGISINESASAKTVHINAADGWDAGVTGNLTASGTITLKWTKLSA